LLSWNAACLDGAARGDDLSADITDSGHRPQAIYFTDADAGKALQTVRAVRRNVVASPMRSCERPANRGGARKARIAWR